MPWRPPNAPPMTMMRAERRPRKKTVLIVFMASFYLDADRGGRRLPLLGEHDLQHAVLVRRADAPLVDVRRQREGTEEGPVRPLGAVELLRLDLPRGLAIPPERERVVVDPHLDLALLEAGQIGAEDDAIPGLVDVDGGGPLAHLDLFLP